MPRPPSWFADVRSEAEKRWTRLEQDRDLAAPWWQLFRQVQNPRHVLSELLQNADDARARRAWVDIVDGTFVFRHDGRDFTAEDFRALCRFGLSNRRTLHTIGFRGIGFKSTFSLGDRVELLTPSLAVAFEKQRFSLPIWLDAVERPERETVVRIRIRDRHVLAQLERNIEEWLRTPLALLFLRRLRTLVIGGRQIRWRHLRGGPCRGAETFELDAPGREGQAAIVFRSGTEPFPPDACEEIREERFLLPDERLELPPCRVDIALGTGWEGGVYAVLPTGVRTGLRFACNAPFLQDPARLHIKEPARSPTNRWLLHRLGGLAARAMLAWLEDESLAAEERAAAYALMPPPAGDGSTLAQEVEAHVERAFAAEIRGRAVVLTAAGDLVEAREAIVADPVLFDVWGEDEIAEVLANGNVRVVSPHVARGHVDRLVARGLVEHRTRRDLLGRLKALRPPRPGSFAGLYALWAYLAPELARAWRWEASELALFPVRHSDRLQKASSCVRFRRSRDLDEEDAGFVLARLEACDEEWFDHLQALTGGGRRDVSRGEPVRQIEHFLRETGLDRPSSANRLVAAVVDRLKLPSPEDTVRLTRIAAKFDVSVPEASPYATLDGAVRRADAGILYDPGERLEDLLPEAVVRTRLLRPVYGRDLSGDVAHDWRLWAARAKSRLLRFPLPEAEDRPMSRREFQRELDRRAVNVRPKYPYASDTVFVADPDFARELWDHWEHLAEDDPAVWAHVTDCLSAEIDRLEERLFLRAHQRGYTYTRPVELAAPLPAAWIVRLRGKRCLPDGDGVARRPEELYRRTPETEGLLGIEPFVTRRLDGEKTAPVLDLLAVEPGLDLFAQPPARRPGADGGSRRVVAGPGRALRLFRWPRLGVPAATGPDCAARNEIVDHDLRPFVLRAVGALPAVALQLAADAHKVAAVMAQEQLGLPVERQQAAQQRPRQGMHGHGRHSRGTNTPSASTASATATAADGADRTVTLEEARNTATGGLRVRSTRARPRRTASTISKARSRPRASRSSAMTLGGTPGIAQSSAAGSTSTAGPSAGTAHACVGSSAGSGGEHRRHRQPGASASSSADFQNVRPPHERHAPVGIPRASVGKGTARA